MDVFVGLFLLLFLIGVYFIPTIVAVERDVVNKWSVAVINGFLGWTLIGWVVALAMALRTVHKVYPQPVQPPPLVTDRTAGSTNDATVTGIGKLADLHREGLLTEDEYASAKARLLGRQSDDTLL